MFWSHTLRQRSTTVVFWLPVLPLFRWLVVVLLLLV